MNETICEVRGYCKRCDMFADTIAVFVSNKGHAEVQSRCPGCLAPLDKLERAELYLSKAEFIADVRRQDKAIEMANEVNKAIMTLPLVLG